MIKYHQFVKPLVEQLRIVLVHPLGGLRQALDLRLLLLIAAHPLQVPLLLLDGVEAVVAGVELCLAVGDLNDPGDGPVQKIPVVADGDHGALEAVDILLQPLHGVEVQVVGGLIQQQDVRVLQNEPPQVYPGLFSSG